MADEAADNAMLQAEFAARAARAPESELFEAPAPAAVLSIAATWPERRALMMRLERDAAQSLPALVIGCWSPRAYHQTISEKMSWPLVPAGSRRLIIGIGRVPLFFYDYTEKQLLVAHRKALGARTVSVHAPAIERNLKTIFTHATEEVEAHEICELLHVKETGVPG